MQTAPPAAMRGFLATWRSVQQTSSQARSRLQARLRRCPAPHKAVQCSAQYGRGAMSETQLAAEVTLCDAAHARREYGCRRACGIAWQTLSSRRPSSSSTSAAPRRSARRSSSRPVGPRPRASASRRCGGTTCPQLKRRTDAAGTPGNSARCSASTGASVPDASTTACAAATTWHPRAGLKRTWGGKLCAHG